MCQLIGKASHLLNQVRGPVNLPHLPGGRGPHGGLATPSARPKVAGNETSLSMCLLSISEEAGLGTSHWAPTVYHKSNVPFLRHLYREGLGICLPRGLTHTSTV